MNSRLAQIIASSVDASGVPDRAKIYEALVLTPDSPEAFLVDAYLATNESIRDLQDTERRLLASHKAALSAEMDQVVLSIKAHKIALEQDAKLRTKWLGIAVAVPIGVCLLLLTAFWFILKNKA